ncbi:hypothetical protein ACFFLM_18000 [Deinococcus oregonensis]|uniref:Uncharacterized protein n=1 Tax=Deinococcus oregonensis TaxID=1805970 RepID=A0ABV6B265_9DEIO
MNTKTRLLIATLAVSTALSFSASAATTPSTTLAPESQTTEKEKAKMLVQLLAAQDQPSTALVTLRLPYVPGAREATAHFTPPEFCSVGKMKVACTLTNAPSQDPTRP